MDGYHILGTNEEAGNFGFIGRRSDEFDDLCYGEDWAVEMGGGASLEMKM